MVYEKRMKKNMRPSGTTFFSSFGGGSDSFSLARGPPALADSMGFSSSDGAAASACIRAKRATGSAGRAFRSAGAPAPPRKEQLAAVSAHSARSTLISCGISLRWSECDEQPGD
eukprot:scaffold10158_cov51-Phaeocystis_antarctica.AAC.2